MAAAAPAREVVVPVAVAVAPPAAAAARPARNWPNLRLRWAQMLFVLGCAAAVLAAFSLNYSSSPMALGTCAPTGAEAAALRAASEKLLLAAAAQVLGAKTAVLLPASPAAVAVFGTLPGLLTGVVAGDLLLLLLVACHGKVHGVIVVYYSFFLTMFFSAYLVGGILSLCTCY